MNQYDALKKYVDAQNDLLALLCDRVTAQSKRIDDLMLSCESLGRRDDAQMELVDALQASYDAKIAMIIEDMASLATAKSE